MLDRVAFCSSVGAHRANLVSDPNPLDPIETDLNTAVGRLGSCLGRTGDTSAEAILVNTARCRGAKEGDGVAHVRKAGDVGEGALKVGMRHRAVAAQIAVSGVVLPVAPRSAMLRCSTAANRSSRWLRPMIVDPVRQQIHRLASAFSACDAGVRVTPRPKRRRLVNTTRVRHAASSTPCRAITPSLGWWGGCIGAGGTGEDTHGFGLGSRSGRIPDPAENLILFSHLETQGACSNLPRYGGFCPLPLIIIVLVRHIVWLWWLWVDRSAVAS